MRTRLIRKPLAQEGESTVIILGIILLIIGIIANAGIIWTIGIIVLLVGVAVAIAGRTGRAIAGRKHWY
jgi:uncharacterized membrane protein HdeD (DUF308 family)